MVPAGQVSNAKLAQALDYGAEVREIEGNFDDCMRAIRDLADEGSAYLVNSINPFRIEGQKTVAFELAEQLCVADLDLLELARIDQRDEVAVAHLLGKRALEPKALHESEEHEANQE